MSPKTNPVRIYKVGILKRRTRAQGIDNVIARVIPSSRLSFRIAVAAKINFKNHKTVSCQIIYVRGIIYEHLIVLRGNIAADKHHGRPTAGGPGAGWDSEETVNAKPAR